MISAVWETWSLAVGYAFLEEEEALDGQWGIEIAVSQGRTACLCPFSFQQVKVASCPLWEAYLSTCNHTHLIEMDQRRKVDPQSVQRPYLKLMSHVQFFFAEINIEGTAWLFTKFAISIDELLPEGSREKGCRPTGSAHWPRTTSLLVVFNSLPKLQKSWVVNPHFLQAIIYWINVDLQPFLDRCNRSPFTCFENAIYVSCTQSKVQYPS